MTDGRILRTEESPGIVTLTLDRPDKRNALSTEILDSFSELLASESVRAARGETRVLILKSSSPKAFCAGADLAERLKMDIPEIHRTLARLRKVMDGLETLPCPVIAVVEGIAFGGGCEMALACDLRIAGPSALFGLTETKLAIIPGAGGTQRLPRIVGEAKAKEMIFLAKSVDANEALRLGLVNAVEADPAAAALVWAKTIVGNGPLAVPAAKKAIQGGRDLDAASALDFERSCYQVCLESSDREEGLKAFVEKRSPAYRGQ